MATNPRSKNPNDAALSAVEEALRLDLSPDDEAEPGSRADRRAASGDPSRPAPEPRPTPTAAQRQCPPPRGAAHPGAAAPQRPGPPRPPRRTDRRRRGDPPLGAARRRPKPQARASLGRGAAAAAAPARARTERRAAASPPMTTAARAGIGGYPRRPSRLIYPAATALSVVWAVVVLVYRAVDRRPVRRRRRRSPRRAS